MHEHVQGTSEFLPGCYQAFLQEMRTALPVFFIGATLLSETIVQLLKFDSATK